MSLVLNLAAIFVVVVTMPGCIQEELPLQEELVSLEKWLKFDIKEPLPKNTLFWEVSFEDEKEGTTIIQQKAGEKVEFFSLYCNNPRMSVRACYNEDCSSFKMMGETSLDLVEDKGHPLIEELTLEEDSLPFKIQVGWMTPPPSTPSSSE